MEKEPSAIVYFKDLKAGILKQTATSYEFAYDPLYLSHPSARPISLSMPLQGEKYQSPDFFPFFDGLLPEGWLLDIVSTQLKIDRTDKFSLLLHTGKDPIGAVSVHPPDEAPRA